MQIQADTPRGQLEDFRHGLQERHRPLGKGASCGCICHTPPFTSTTPKQPKDYL